MDHASKPVEARKKRGRPRKVSDAERKERDIARSKKYRKTVVALSYSFKAWQTLKEKGHWNHAELAEHLLDVHSRFCKQPNCASSGSFPNQPHAVSNKNAETEIRRDTHYHEERLEQPSNQVAPVPIHAANFVAPNRPVRLEQPSNQVAPVPIHAANSAASNRPIRLEQPSNQVAPVPIQAANSVASYRPIRLKQSSNPVAPVPVTWPAANFVTSYRPIRLEQSSNQVAPVPIQAANPVASYRPIRLEQSSNQVAPVPVKWPAASFVASYRPFRSKEEVKASGAVGSLDLIKNATVLPKPARNENDSSNSESINADSVSIYTVAVPEEEEEEEEEDMTETSDEEQDKEQEKQGEEGEEEDGDVGGEIVQEEVEMKEPANVDDFSNFRENLEPDLERVQEEVEMKKPANVDNFSNFQENLEPYEKGIKDGSGSDFDIEGAENDSDWGAAMDRELVLNDDIDEEGWYSSEEGESPKEKRQKLDDQGTDVPFKRFDIAEVAKAEGVSFPLKRLETVEVEKAEDVSGSGSNKTSPFRLKKLYWTELERVYRCKICTFEDSNAYSTSRHLIQEHAELVGDLVDYLKEKPATDSESSSTLYDMVMEFPPSSDSTDVTNKGSESCDKVGEEKDSVEIPEEGSKANESKAKESGGTEKKDNPFDTMESVELLMRWVKLKTSCQFCQKVIRCRLFTQKGERIIHRCRLGNSVSALCDMCGKSFPYPSFRLHWAEIHCKKEQGVCPYCGKMMRMVGLNSHILRCHTNKKDEYLCGICRKGFRCKTQRDVHEVIHQKEKPFKCSYCQRGFTQSSNMRYHMRQHTGEKPYHCEMCPESFAHNVSLKNHLKSRHGIDPWKTGATGDLEPSFSGY